MEEQGTKKQIAIQSKGATESNLTPECEHSDTQSACSHDSVSRCRHCGSRVQDMMKYGPFCSSRCRSLDLGNWALEEYRIEAEQQPKFQKPVEVVPSPFRSTLETIGQ
jgi:endogenous inhibitor of DNA gyrase (YacG/DUF329 family)